MSNQETVPEDVLISEYLENESQVRNERPRLYAPQPVRRLHSQEKEDEPSEKRGVITFQM